MRAGAVTLGGIAVLLPPVGPRALAWYRGREIASPAAQAILPRLMLLTSVALLGLAGFWWSTGKLLARDVPKADDDARARARIGWKGWLAVLVPVALFAMSLVILARHSLDYDEIAELSADVAPGFPHSLNSRSFINHLSGSLLARVGLMLGRSELAIRLPTLVLACVGAMASGFLLARISALAAFASGLLLSTQPLLISQTAQIRGYAAFYWMGLLSVLLVSTALADSKPRPPERRISRILALGAASLLLGVSHLFGFLWLGALCAMTHAYAWTGSAALGNGSREVPPEARGVTTQVAVLTCTATLSFLYWVPSLPWLLYYQVGTRGSLQSLQLEASSLLVGDRASRTAIALAAVAVGAAGVVFVRIPFARMVVLLGAIPTAGAFVAAVLSSPTFFYARFLGLGAVLTFVWVGLAASIPQRLVTRAAMVSGITLVAALLFVPALLSFLRDRAGNREAAARLVEWRTPELQRGGAFVLFGGWQAEAVAGYYLPRNALSPAGELSWSQRRRAGRPDCLVSVAPSLTDLPAWFGSALAGASERRTFPVTNQSPLECWCYE
jgi:hypothetical protein